ARSGALPGYAATRTRTPADRADAVVTLFHARLEAKDRLLDDRAQVFRLLVALDRPADLEKDLVAWIRPDDVDPRWPTALAYLQAETNRVREAATTLEATAAKDDLDAATWGVIAQWYLGLKEDARRDDALDHRLAGLPEVPPS